MISADKLEAAVKNGRRAAVSSVGCKVSNYDARRAEEVLFAAGYEIVPFSSQAEVYVINTCAVTNIADKKSRTAIKRALKKNPGAVIVAMGCYSQLEPEEVCAAGAHIALGAEGFKSIIEALEKYFSDFPALPEAGLASAELAAPEDSESINTPGHGAARTRAYLKIQDGCDKFCSYCVIPYARGRVKSRTPEDILLEAESLAEKGVKEIVLTGIHVASYGKDLEKDGPGFTPAVQQFSSSLLTAVCEMVSGVPGIERFRLSSLSPLAVTESFVAALAALNVCPHFHLSLQSGAESVLKSMNRGYTKEDYLRAVRLLYGAFPGCAVWSDIIVGFPGETERDFEESMAFIEESGIVKLHIFPFSPKKGTKAFSMPGQTDAKTKTRRASALAELDARLYSTYLKSRIGTEARVLYEEFDGVCSAGHTENYIYVKIPAKRKPNQTAVIKITGFDCRGTEFDVYGEEI